MKHEIFREWIVLSVYGELGHEERKSLDRHLAECAPCRAELQELGSFVSLVREAGVPGPSDEVLRGARRSLRDALASGAAFAERAVGTPEKNLTQDGAWSRSGASRFPAGGLRVWLASLSPGRAVLAGAAAIAVGFVAGYFVFNAPDRGGVERGVTGPSRADLRPAAELGAPVYRNVRLADVDPRTSEVDIEYDLVRPARLKAGIDDERVQKALAHAVTNEENPGKRLQAINTISAYVAKPGDEEIKRALIRAVKTDPNPGVRKQALYVLYQLPFDDDIKRACLEVLASDGNEGLRIAAINMLAVAALDGQVQGQEILDEAGARLQKDDNDYIRIQSGTFLQEVNGHGE
jgi:anti-sigma factor RsiW